MGNSATPHKNDSQHGTDDAPVDFDALIQAGLTRRSVLAGIGIGALGLFFASTPLSKAVASSNSRLLGFTPVPASTQDLFVVPDAYTATPLISWGEPILPGAPAFDPSGTQAASAQALQFGDNNDGMSLFPIEEDRALLAVNNEYINLEYLYAHRGSAITADDVLKAQYAHGVSIVEISRQNDGQWRVDRESSFNRRINLSTPMQIIGPAAGHALLQTDQDSSGRSALGTLSNCANGKTPWGTYLTCEENFQDYFASSSPVELAEMQRRYGLSTEDEEGMQWFMHDERFDLSKHPQEANRFGWVVEVDPHDPTDVPRKLTALGRMAHENAELVISPDGHVVVYMGDDARGEHIYKFVSRDRYNPDNQQANRHLLENGTLYVARFHAEPGELSGTGEWLELTYGKNGLNAASGFKDQAEILIYARAAATVVGATTMDRPEWIAVHPGNGSVYCTLTNNRNRGLRENQPVDGPNPRQENHYGQIVRWWPADANHSSVQFEWDLFLIAGNPNLYPDTLYAGSANITADNMFNSPDGIGFDADGRLWIQTDGDFSNGGDFLGMGNNQVLCADTASGEIRRFATGPLGCELTGLAFTPDQRTLFIGVQHPGSEGTESHFPAGGNSKPRSTIMMIQREDGGVIGT
jgi:secreted PhoX family phosphatase